LRTGSRRNFLWNTNNNVIWYLHQRSSFFRNTEFTKLKNKFSENFSSNSESFVVLAFVNWIKS
jgi:hypothetical protein